ncbi:MAG: ATP-grasp domain-containing protein [Polyangiaceae bacterium]
MNIVLFCSQPFEPSQVDSDFAAERSAATHAHFATALFEHTMAVEGDIHRAIRRIPENAGAALYRGWMFRANRYEELYHALLQKGVQLLNTPLAYRTCHHLPESYAILGGSTPRSTWLPVRDAVDFDAVFDCLRPFGSGSIVIKDYVKSQKHYWNEACFIPRADDRETVKKVVRRFLELQGEDLAEGLVFREYVPLQIVGTHPRSGMPLAAEIRTFWLDGQMVLKHAYWADLGAVQSEPPTAWLEDIARRVPSRFFTMDVALREDGAWTVIELGDGQVAGLPTPDLAESFYRRLRSVGASLAPPR